MNSTQVKNNIIKGAKSAGKWTGKNLLKSAVGLAALGPNVIASGTKALVKNDAIKSIATIGGMIGITALVPGVLPLIVMTEGANILDKTLMGKDINIGQDVMKTVSIGNKATTSILNHTMIPLLTSVQNGVSKAQHKVNDKINDLFN